MKYHWYGITYFSINGYLPNFVYILWQRFFCKKGIHLLDEVMGTEGHYLYCDACQLAIHIDDKLG